MRAGVVDGSVSWGLPQRLSSQRSGVHVSGVSSCMLFMLQHVGLIHNSIMREIHTLKREQRTGCSPHKRQITIM